MAYQSDDDGAVINGRVALTVGIYRRISSRFLYGAGEIHGLDMKRVLSWHLKSNILPIKDGTRLLGSIFAFHAVILVITIRRPLYSRVQQIPSNKRLNKTERNQSMPLLFEKDAHGGKGLSYQ